MNFLELFSGSAIFSRTAALRGHSTKTLDFEAVYSPDICKDILDFKPSDLPDGWIPDVIWASPECACFSVASIGTHWWEYSPKTEEAKQAIRFVKTTVNVINDLKPKRFFVENPRGMLRKLDLVPGRLQTVSYCRYGDTRMKPTDIWTNSSWVGRPMCNNGNPDHQSAPRGSRTGTQGISGKFERAVLPLELCTEIIMHLESELQHTS